MTVKTAVIVSHIVVCLIFFKCLLILRQTRGSAHEQGGAGQRKRVPSRLCTASTEPDMGLDLMNHEIMTWAKIKSLRLNWLSHPSTLRYIFALTELGQLSPKHSIPFQYTGLNLSFQENSLELYLWIFILSIVLFLFEDVKYVHIRCHLSFFFIIGWARGTFPWLAPGLLISYTR